MGKNQRFWHERQVSGNFVDCDTMTETFFYDIIKPDNRIRGATILKLAVVDDENEHIERITEYGREFCLEHFLAFECDSFHNGEDFLKTFDQGKYEIIFMDIYMKGMNGMETTKKLRELDRDCIVIFLTTSTDFMPDAFSCHAYDYIVKPFTKERVFQAFHDVLYLLAPAKRYITINVGRKNVSISLEDITSVISDGHYLEITLKKGTILRSRMTSKELMEKVDNDMRFILVNKGVILNADYIMEVENLNCVLINGTSFPIRIRNHVEVEQAIQDYNFKKLRNMQRHCH